MSSQRHKQLNKTQQMKKRNIKKLVLGTLGITLLLVVVLAVHIYMVTRPKPATASTVAMARIDFKQTINDADASKVAQWLYQQKGVDHVLINAQTKIGVFTFYPVKANATTIINNLQSNLHYSVQRYIPTAEEMKGGCPVASNSLAYKFSSFIQKVF